MSAEPGVAPKKSKRKAKPKPAERAVMEYTPKNGTTASSVPLVDHALACIRQWVALENLPVETLEDIQSRDEARAALRKVAELAINYESSLFACTEAGHKGGTAPREGGKKTAILPAAERFQTIGPAQLQAIARKTDANVRTVRDTLTKAGMYAPRRKREM